MPYQFSDLIAISDTQDILDSFYSIHGITTEIYDLYNEAGLDMNHFARCFDSGEARAAVLEEGRVGKEIYQVRGTPTIMLGDGKKLRHPMAYANIRDGKILSVGRLPCCGEGCYEATRELFEQALKQPQERIADEPK